MDRPFTESDEQRRKLVAVTGVMFAVMSLLGMALGAAAFAFTENIHHGAFWAHFPAFFVILFGGVGLWQKKSGVLFVIVALILCGLCLMTTFAGTVVDGIMAGRIQNTDLEVCGFTAEDRTIQCGSVNCTMDLDENTCYCCHIFAQNNVHGICNGPPIQIYDLKYTDPDEDRDDDDDDYDDEDDDDSDDRPEKYVGVDSCESVHSRMRNLHWASMAMCLFSLLTILILGVFTIVYLLKFKEISTTTPATPRRRVTPAPAHGASYPMQQQQAQPQWQLHQTTHVQTQPQFQAPQGPSTTAYQMPYNGPTVFLPMNRPQDPPVYSKEASFHPPPAYQPQ